MHRSITLLCLVAGMMAAEAGSTVTYDATYASWLSQSWTTAGGTSTHGSILEASQKIDPGFIHRVTYRDTKEIGLKPFASIAAGSDSTYAQAIGGLKYNFNESWGINAEVEYGTFNVHTATTDSAGVEHEHDGTSTYQSALVSVGVDSFGGYVVMRQHKVPNMLRYRQDDGRTLDMYFDKDYSTRTVMLGLYTKLSTDCAGGTLSLDLRAAIGQCFGTSGSEAQAAFEKDWGYKPINTHFKGYEAAADLGYEHRIGSFGLCGFGVRALGFGNVAAFDTGTGSHNGGSTGQTQGISGSPDATRIDAFWGPYLRVGAVF